VVKGGPGPGVFEGRTDCSSVGEKGEGRSSSAKFTGITSGRNFLPCKAKATKVFFFSEGRKRREKRGVKSKKIHGPDLKKKQKTAAEGGNRQ